MRQKIHQFSQRPFVRNVMTVASGTAAAQAITMAFSPLITRLYGPEAYGLMGVFMSMAGIIGAIAALTYPIAIVLPRSDADALGLVRLSIYIGIATSLMATAALFFFGPEILAFLNAQEISRFMYLIPATMLISVVSAVLSQWLIRKKAFMLTAKVAVWGALLMSIIKTCLGLIHPTAVALITTNALGGLLATVLMLLGMRRTQHIGQPITDLSKAPSDIWSLAQRHRDFALLRAPQVLLNSASQSLPILLLAIYFGPSAVGFYTIAIALLSVPAGLIGGSVMQVFYPRFNEAVQNGENLAGLMLKATIGMGIVGFAPFVIVVAFGPFLFDLVFGGEWRTAGEYAQWLALWLFFAFLNRPAVSAMPALRSQDALLMYEVISVILRTIALYIGFSVLKSDIGAMSVFSVIGALLNAFLIMYVIHLCQIRRILSQKEETNE